MITRYDPFREALSLRRAMDQLFEQSVVPPGLMPGAPSLIAPMDVFETPNGYEVDVALPGVRPEDIELTVDQNSLTIRGRYSHQDERQNQSQSQMQGGPSQQQSQQPGGGQQAQQQSQQPGGGQQPQRGRTERQEKGHNWLLREIVSGSYERTITFPRPINTNNIQTKFQNGILTVMVPVSEESRPKRIGITGSESQPQQVAVGAGQQQR
jgi:HSP20 family protein